MRKEADELEGTKNNVLATEKTHTNDEWIGLVLGSF